MSDTKQQNREVAVAAVKKQKADFETGWKTQSMHLSALTSDDWHKEKSFAAVKSAKWFQKSNNIGPKLDKLQSAREKLDKHVNRTSYQGVGNAILDLDKALAAFRKNREGATPQQTKDINTVVDTYSKIVASAAKWLSTQEKTIATLDKAEMLGLLDTI